LILKHAISLFVHPSAKAWTVVVVAGLCGGAATMFYFPSAKAGSNSPQANPGAAVEASHPGGFSHVGGLERSCGSVPMVPEANAGLVLIPVVAAALFFSTRRLWSAKVTANPEGQELTR
jgi:hypothetical protein